MGYKCFKNEDCEFFPCHKGVNEEEFNCIFCFCPLYSKGTECGGCYTLTGNGIKDCSHCSLPHKGESGYDWVLKRLLSK
ncbi:MAG: cysteine-rich small domain-containing protein [Paludibacteraceae bacterium]|nr:cysteine-rich small domain-containing protein [Paludibacteraceae bacterium]